MWSPNHCFADGMRFKPNYDNQLIFTPADEDELADYLLLASKHHHGLTKRGTRELAYEYATKNNRALPPSWTINKIAGVDWMYGFMQRHKGLSIRTPEATSLSRATSFNRTNVGRFYDNLETVINRHQFQPDAIYNVDETGLTTVHKPPKVVAGKGEKQVGQVTSAERGVLVTMCGAVNALGNAIPPFLIFPRVNFKDHMIGGAPPGTVGAVHPSGWMTGENFHSWLQHFVTHSHCSLQNPLLLLMDNHDSHITVSSLDLAKASGIVLVTFPPHCSHKLQPVDRTVYGPLKRHYNTACNSWQMRNPGKPMTIYDIAGNLGEAFPRAFTPGNIVAGFKATGIWPFNREVFGDDEFLSAYVTDRPAPTNDQLQQQESEHDVRGDVVVASLPQSPTPSTSTSATLQHVSPHEVRPFPKAQPRKNNLGRKKGQTLILTDTPVKKRIQGEILSRVSRQPNKGKCLKMDKEMTAKHPKSTAVTAFESELESDSDDDLVEFEIPSRENLTDGTYVLVQYASKKRVTHFAGVTLGSLTEDGTLQVQFLKRQGDGHAFVFPDKLDSDQVDLGDIVTLLPEPVSSGGTDRAVKRLMFPGVDFSVYNL